MNVFRANTGQDAYVKIVQEVINRGLPREPRGKETLDLGFSVIELDSPYRALPLGVGRKLNVNIAIAEAVQLVGGFSNPQLLLKASPSFQAYLDDSKFYGSYGARAMRQVEDARNKINEDPNTRQAIITFWDPDLDNVPGKRDYPCTVMLQFEMRQGVLNMNVVMRSNDVWLGLPYDMFQFTQLQLSVANSLDVGCGTYRHTALSLHIYKEHIEAADALHACEKIEWQPEGFGIVDEAMPFTDIMRRARIISRGLPNLTLIPKPTRSEVWYSERFASYMG